MPSLMATLGLNWSGFRSGSDSAVSHAKLSGNKISSALGSAITSRLAGLASVAGLEEVMRKTVQYAEQVDDLSKRLGISTDAIQAWDYALKMNGSSIEGSVTFFEKLAMSRKKALEGKDEFINSFKALGVTLDDLKTKRLEGIAEQIALAFESGDPQKLIADLRELGGRGAGQMAAAFRDGLTGWMKEARETGKIIGEETLDGLNEAADRWKSVWAQIRAAIAPTAAALSNFFTGAWQGFSTLSKGLAASLVYGPKYGFQLMRDEARRENEAREREEKRRERRKKQEPFLGGGDEEDTKKSLKSAEKEATERERLAERLHELQQKNYLATLSKEQQITELHRRRAELAVWLAANESKLTEANRLRARIDLEELKGEEESAQRGLKGSEKAKQRKAMDLNTLQQIGAYTSAYSDGGRTLERTALDVHKKNEGHLAAIRDVLVKGPTAGRGVKF